MNLANWKHLFTTSSNQDDIINFVISHTKEILDFNLLTCNYTHFILQPNIHIEKYREPILNVQKRTFNEFGDYLFQKHVKKSSIPISKLKISNETSSEIIEMSDFIKTNHNNNTFEISFNFNSIISKPEYRSHFIKYFLHLFVMSDVLKLSDFDLNQIKINKDTHVVKIQNVQLKLDYISSIELKEYLLKQLYSDDQTICKKIIDTIIILNNKGMTYSGLYDTTFKALQEYCVKIDINLYNILNNKDNKYLIIKYLFSKYNNLSDIKNIDQLFKIFNSTDQVTVNNLLDLVKQMILTNNSKMLEYILKNKPIKIDVTEYKKLQQYASQLNLFDLNKILLTFETIDAFGF